MGDTTHDESQLWMPPWAKHSVHAKAGFIGKIQILGGEASHKRMPLFKRLKYSGQTGERVETELSERLGV